jgi:hypothetical protein
MVQADERMGWLARKRPGRDVCSSPFELITFTPRNTRPTVLTRENWINLYEDAPTS